MTSETFISDEFTVNLVSNASMEIYPDNKLSTFTTQLPGHGLELPPKTNGGYWEMALLELSFPSKFKNVTRGRFFFGDVVIDGGNVPAGHYNSAYDVLSIIKSQINKKFIKLGHPNVDPHGSPPFDFKIDGATERASIKLNTQIGLGLFGFVDPDLCNMLGFNLQKMRDGAFASQGYPRGQWITGDYSIDVQQLHTMMVYTDVIEHQIVGDILTPLLRIVPLTSKLKTVGVMAEMQQAQVVHRYQEPLQYKRLQRYNFHSIRIEMYGENGELMPFLDVGRTNLTLLFRYRRKNF